MFTSTLQHHLQAPRLLIVILTAMAITFGGVSGCGKYSFIKSKDHRLNLAYETHTAVVEAVATAMEDRLITASQGRKALDMAKAARAALDTAKAILDGVEAPAIEDGVKKDFKYYLKYGVALLAEAKKHLPAQSASPALFERFDNLAKGLGIGGASDGQPVPAYTALAQ